MGGGNDIDSAGGEALAQCLPSCPSLKVLGLDKNHIGDVGAKAIAKVLPSCGLETLDLKFNNLGNTSVEVLTKVILNCTRLKLICIHPGKDLERRVLEQKMERERKAKGK